MEKRLECTVFGRVQMVMFRDFVTRNALSRGLVGTVTNNPDGSVSVVVQGDEANLQDLLVRIHKGSLLSRVDRVDVRWGEPLGKFKTFDILY